MTPSSSRPSSSLPALVIALAAFACAGCETFSPAQTCDMSPQDNPTVVYAGGTVTDGVYMSSPWNSGWLLFDGGEQYKLVTHLDKTPAWQQLWVSFAENGATFFDEGAGGSSTAAQAAGNEAQVESVDETGIQVGNLSCSNYYLLVIAGTDGTPQPSPP